jgi:hypothetical protein
MSSQVPGPTALWVRLHEKGGKFHEMPCHHTLEGYFAEAGRGSLFQVIALTAAGRRN